MTCNSTFALLALLALVSGCRNDSSIKGALKLDVGHLGDMRGARVAVYNIQDMSEPPVAVFFADSGPAPERATFHSPRLPAGIYFLLGWQDVNRDTLINDGDLVGVGGAKYRHKYAGEPFLVTAGNAANVGDVTVYVLREPVRSARGERTSGGTVTDFSYVCYHDLTLHSLSITFPGLGTFDDPLASGPKTGDTTYRSDGWTFSGGPMPQGEHILIFRGRMDDEPFEVRFLVEIE